MPSIQSDVIHRPSTPLSKDFAAQQRQKQLGNNYHSSSLARMINPHSVNKTNLHPGGVECVYASHLRAIPTLEEVSLTQALLQATA